MVARSHALHEAGEAVVTMADESRHSCESPRWTTTKRGRRCGRVCVDDRGRRRFRFVKGAECGGEPSAKLEREREEVSEFSALENQAEAIAGVLGVPLEPLERVEPLPLIPLVGSGGGREKRR